MSSIILVHGAFHGAWCWHRVVPELRRLGHRVQAVDLPGHGTDSADRSQVTLDDYVERLAAAVEAEAGKVVLVGHSMGGFVIGEAAERVADKIERLIYLTAFVASPGRSLAELAGETQPTTFSNNLSFADGCMQIDPSAVPEAFFADCDDASVALAELCLVPQPGAVLMAQASVTDARMGSLPASYLACSEDQAIALVDQQQMAERAGAEPIVLRSGHSPFFSMPERLAESIHDCLGH